MTKLFPGTLISRHAGTTRRSTDFLIVVSVGTRITLFDAGYGDLHDVPASDVLSWIANHKWVIQSVPK